MEMEVVVPVPPVDFNFDSNCSSPYMTAPSSPQRFGNFFYFSVPTSPTHASSSFYRELNDNDDAAFLAINSSSAIPFDWEEKPGIPKARNEREVNDIDNNKKNDEDGDGDDFEFNFSGHLERTSLSADELFDGGKIRPLKPPPGYDSSASTVSSPRSPRSRTTQKKDIDPFEAAIEETRRRAFKQLNQEKHQQQRGRERRSNSSTTTSSYVRKGTRSLSPLRVSDIMLEHGENPKNVDMITSTTSNAKSSYVSSIFSAIPFSKGYKKWKLRDFLLFRSASEGRATGKDPLTKYTVLSKKEVVEDAKNSSFRSAESVGSSRRRGNISAHEMHYTVNRAVSEEMRRKTFLPYKQGLLGCLGFNPGVHEFSRGVGSLTRV